MAFSVINGIRIHYEIQGSGTPLLMFAPGGFGSTIARWTAAGGKREWQEMDGLATLQAIRARAPELPVLMFSGLTERAGTLTLEALSLGANDYVTKPSNVGSSVVPVERVRDELLAKVRALLDLGGAPRMAPRVAAPSARQALAAPRARIHGVVEVLAIGASTGGPNALADILAALPADFPVPIVIAQHMPPMFTKLFADRLDAQCTLRVREAATGERLVRGDVWIAPGDYHMVVRRDGEALELFVHQGLPENSCRPSVDVLFRSVAEAFGASALGVVLTGMGTDGLRGAERLRALGGQVVVQDEASSVVWSMPGSVATAGLADDVVALEHMAVSLVRRVGRGRGEGAGRSAGEERR